jgi:hypothetical protein
MASATVTPHLLIPSRSSRGHSQENLVVANIVLPADAVGALHAIAADICT